MGYYNHKYRLSFVLDAISEHGLPVDRGLQDKLRAHLESEEIKLSALIQAQVPEELRPIHPKQGFKGWPKDLREAVKAGGLWEKGRGPLYYSVIAEQLGYTERLFELEDDAGESYTELRLCKRLEFNPNSQQQLLAYIQYQIDNATEGHWYVPLHIDTGKPTVGKEELNQLIDATDDEVLKLAQKIKKLTKLKGTYTAGAWIPEADGRVHGTFRYGTASQQTACVNPNIQQYPEHYDPNDAWITEIMKQVKGCIRAEPGYKLIKVDARGAHGRMQGWLAEDPDYYRLASLDLHSYNTAYVVDVPDKDDLIQMDDASLLKRLKVIKKEFKHERDFMVKRVSFLSQYGGGADKASRILRLEPVVVQKIMDTIANRFPKTFKKFPKSVKRMLNNTARIISPHGTCRWFWDGNMEEATAFLPSSCFHCHIQDALIALYDRGACAKYGMCNFPHDAAWYHCPIDLVDECIAVTKEEFEKPSTVLVNSLGPFWCSADAQVGDSLLEMEDA